MKNILIPTLISETVSSASSRNLIILVSQSTLTNFTIPIVFKILLFELKNNPTMSSNGTVEIKSIKNLPVM